MPDFLIERTITITLQTAVMGATDEDGAQSVAGAVGWAWSLGDTFTEEMVYEAEEHPRDFATAADAIAAVPMLMGEVLDEAIQDAEIYGSFSHQWPRDDEDTGAKPIIDTTYLPRDGEVVIPPAPTASTRTMGELVKAATQADDEEELTD